MKKVEVSLTELLNSFEYYVDKDFSGDCVNFIYELDGDSIYLDIFWGKGDNNDFHIELYCTKYNTLDDEYGTTHVIKDFFVTRVDKGNQYDTAKAVVRGLNKYKLLPILQTYFDKHSDRPSGKHVNFTFDMEADQ